MNELSAIDRVRLIAHGSLGLPEPEGDNVVSFVTFSKAKHERQLAEWRRRVERNIARDWDDGA